MNILKKTAAFGLAIVASSSKHTEKIVLMSLSLIYDSKSSLYIPFS